MNPVTVGELWGAESCKATYMQATVPKAMITLIMTWGTTNLWRDVGELGPIGGKKVIRGRLG